MGRHVVGIDLGATNSVVARVDDSGRVVVLPSASGREITPSVVYFEPNGSAIVGEGAVQATAVDPNNGVLLIKRMMGTDYPILLRGQQHTPESISALILRQLTDTAAGPGEQVSAVITVPAYFGLAEREATYQAGLIAGIDVLELLDEPVAAAISYGLPSGGDQTVLVYDLGGGTFDATVLRITSGAVQVLATDGHHDLGGADVDRRLLDLILDRLEDQLSPAAVDNLGEDPQWLWELALNAEAAKKDLSAQTSCLVTVNTSAGRRVVTITRQDLDEACEDLYATTVEIVGRVLHAANMDAGRGIDQVIMVGGSSRIPVLAERLTAMLGKTPQLVEPDFAVAKGAALRADYLARIAQTPALVPARVTGGGRVNVGQVTAVAPRAVGILMSDSLDPAGERTIVEYLVMANTPLPVDIEKQFMTILPDQGSVRIQVYEQAGLAPSPDVEHNRRVLDGQLTGIGSLKAGSVIRISVRIAADGRLTVIAHEPRSGRELQLEAFVEGVTDRAETERLTFLHERVAAMAESLTSRRSRVFAAGRDMTISRPRAGNTGAGPPDPGREGGGPSNSRYLQARCPDAVPVGRPFSLLASIVQAGIGAVAQLVPFDVPAGGQDVLLVLHAPGLRLLSDQRLTVHVPAAGDSSPVMFELRADEEGPRSISITAWLGGSYLGELLVEITADRDRVGGQHREFRAEIGTEPSEGAVSLVVRYDPELKAYRFEFRDEDNPNEVVSRLSFEPRQRIEKLVADLDRIAAGHSGYSANQARDYLVNAGAELWRELVPPGLREQFWDRQHRIRQLTILTDMDTVPWELLYPRDPGHDAGFLVQQFPVTRGIFGRRPAPRLSLWPARFVLPRGSLPEAEIEIDAMRRLLDPLQAPEVVISELTPLQNLIRAGDFGLLHFACHNRFEPDNDASIRLGSVQFTPRLMTTAVIDRVLARSAPTVFMNACRSAGLAPTYNRIDGWAGKFLEAGAGAFIGSLWAVSDGTARDFAEELYGQLKTGAPLGKAMMDARAKAATHADDPTWLAYSAYGDPRAKATAPQERTL